MRRRERAGALFLALAGLLVAGAAPAQPAVAEGAAEATAAVAPARAAGPIARVRIDGMINPAAADHLAIAVERAEKIGASILLLELDTPGGLVTSTKDMIQTMMGSEVPVVVYVAPHGAWAASAGTFITLAGHVAAMAPGSTIGAAHPVGTGGTDAPKEGEDGEQVPADYAGQKAENMLAAYVQSVAKERGRNFEWAEKAVRESEAVTAEEALELNVIDLVAEDREALLAAIEGREVETAAGTVAIHVEGARVEDVEMDALLKLLHAIVDPNIAGLLLMVGALGLYIEFNNPGLVVPGLVGVACTILGLIAAQVLPFSWTGAVLCLIGIGLMVAEAFVSAFGALLAAGMVFLLLGGSMIFDVPEVSDVNIDFWRVLVPIVVGTGLCMGAVVIALARSRGMKQQAGTDELVGMVGVASTALAPSGTVFIRGEYWSAEADEEIEADARIEATAVEGLRLKVKRAGL